MFKNMKFSIKLIGSFIIVAIIASVIGFVGVSGMRTMEADVKEIAEVKTPSAVSVLIISEAQTVIDGDENALLDRNITDEERRVAFEKFDAAKKRADDAWKIYEPLPQTKEEAEAWKDFVPAWNKWWNDHEEFVRLTDEYKRNPSDANYNKMSHQALETNGISLKVAEDLLNKIKDINVKGAEEAGNAAQASASSMSAIMLFALALGVIVALTLGIFISISITGQINRIIAGLTEGAEQVGSASEQVASASQSLAEGASEQASSLEETSSSLEEMSSMTKQNADNARQANMLAAEASKAADKGVGAMRDMSQAIQEIKKSSDETAKIIRVIDEIAFQTNLLALNAAVEAARAGEAGKGFAVVAEEVRNLAQRSAEAAKNTSSLIEGAQKNADNGVRATEEFVGILGEITSSIKKVNDLVSEVTVASDEQSQGIGQITSAVSQMDQVTQQNASNAEESASASEELAAQAQQMQEIVAELNKLVKGANAVMETSSSNNNSRRKTTHSITLKSPTSHGLKDKVHDLVAKTKDHKGLNKTVIAGHKPMNKAQEMIPLEKEEMANF